ncbi:hypothetical protein D6D19_07837 [Aureobasidium pullulans]|uniref:Inheritance of peroxisomes protein 1 n=1 Tax=Aureobasidium pullulans TaxID=5580 RepID=A0A4S8ZVQ7_AURPU|nr:hypothetical protein D6D19_07837 [Aureobasidium pullulans]THY13463.1 hypothetical protein D6D00_10148 [Aureobasidium pullulans]
MSSRPSSSTCQDMPSASAPGLRRSFTLPSRLANPPKAQQQVEIGSADGIETLFVHPSAKIVSFSSASSLRSRPSSRSSIASYDGEADCTTSLPWTSPTERTMAAGPLEIYRVPGSVAFLHSGSLLHAILPRSQCWCVDGVSKFAMRVLPNTYYRIELPGNTKEDLENVEQLKKTLAKVLYYERTACPFQRGFGDDLPEMPSRNSRRLSREFIEPAKRWRLDKVWRPEGAELEEPQLLHPDRNNYTSDTDRSEIDDAVKSEAEDSGKEQDTRPASRDKPTQLSGPFASKRLATMRSVTAPPQLSLESSPPFKANKVRKMAGIFNQTGRDTVQTLPRPLSTTRVPRLPPTPESTDDDHDLPLQPADQPSDQSTTVNEPLDSISGRPIAIVVNEHGAPVPTEPLIIVEQADDEFEHNHSSDTHLEAEDAIVEAHLPEEPQDQAVTGASDAIEEAKAETTSTAIVLEEATLQNSAEEQLLTDYPTSSPATSTTETISTATFTASSPALSTTSLSTATSWSTLPVLTPTEATDLLRQRRAPSPSPSLSTRSSSPPAPTQTPAKPTSSSTALIKTSPALLVRKTCALFLGPPANLVATMLRIAARLVASGALNLAEPAFHDLFAGNGANTSAAGAIAAGRLRGHRRVPGSWDLSDDDEDWGF